MTIFASHHAFTGSPFRFALMVECFCQAAGYACDGNYPFEASTGSSVASGRLPSEYLSGRWQVWPQDPLIVLALFETEGGLLLNEILNPLADRLKSLAPAAKLIALTDYATWNEMGVTMDTFIKGLRSAARRGEKISFL